MTADLDWDAPVNRPYTKYSDDGVVIVTFDNDIVDELNAAESEIRDEIYNQVYGSIVDQAGSDTDELFAEIRADAENIRNLVEPHAAALQEKVQKLNGLLSEIQIDVDVSTEPPRSELELDNSDWFFDSRRDYVTQLDWYHGRRS